MQAANGEAKLADLAMASDSVNLKGMQTLPFKQDTIWIVGNREHPLFMNHKEQSSVLFRDTLDYEHISYHDGGVLDNLIADARRKEGRSAKHRIKLCVC